jgi:hypothetical protein
LPESLSESDSLPAGGGKAPVNDNKVPEPDGLWLSGTALAGVLLLRRKPRRPQRG